MEYGSYDIDAARGALNALGWKADFETACRERSREGLIPARVLSRHRDRWSLALPLPDSLEGGRPYREGEGILPGALRADPDRADADQPTVGDWVLVDARGVIRDVLPRRSAFLRRRAGKPVMAQAIAANADYAAIVMGLDENYNLRRLERYLSLSWDSGAAPLVVLSKVDVAEEREGPDALAEKLRAAQVSAPAIPVFALCALSGRGMGEFASALGPGTTTLFLGSSGAGKSTLLNALAGEELQDTGGVREADGKGKHTTTRRDLFLLPSGAMVIDTPGMRELGLWGDDSGGVESEFPEIEALAASCRFDDCRHEGEPGCAVRAALDSGALDPGRFRSYEKQKKELAYLGRLTDSSAARAERQKWKSISKWQKKLKNGF